MYLSEFKANLIYRASSRSARATHIGTCIVNKQRNKNQKELADFSSSSTNHRPCPINEIQKITVPWEVSLGIKTWGKIEIVLVLILYFPPLLLS